MARPEEPQASEENTKHRYMRLSDNCSSAAPKAAHAVERRATKGALGSRLPRGRKRPVSVVSRINKPGPRTAAEALCSDSVYLRHRIVASSWPSCMAPLFLFHLPGPAVNLVVPRRGVAWEISGHGIIEKFPRLFQMLSRLCQNGGRGVRWPWRILRHL